MNCDIFLELNEVIAHLACWTDPETHSKTPDEIILVIPGNPGLIGFYTKYLECLHKSTNLPVWIVGHGGHEEPNEEDIPREHGVGIVKGRERSFGLLGQLQQKVDFLTDMIDKPTKIHVVGHSIGGWMAMELLKHPEIGKRIVSVTLLYPTLEYIADTPNGFWVNKVCRRITPIIYFLLFIFNSLPLIIKTYILLIHFYFNGIASDNLNSVLKYFRPAVMEKVLFMAFDEMDLVRNLDFENLKSNKNKINIIYTETDGWAPGKRFKQLQENIPDLHIEEVPYSHAFVLHSSEEIASITRRFIMKKDM